MTIQRIVGVGNLDREKVGLGVPLARGGIDAPRTFDGAFYGATQYLAEAIVTSDMLPAVNRRLVLEFAGDFTSAGAGGEIWTLNVAIGTRGDAAPTNVVTMSMTDSAVTDVFGGRINFTFPVIGSAGRVAVAGRCDETTTPSTDMANGYVTADLSANNVLVISLRGINNLTGTESVMRLSHWDWSLWGQS